MITYENVSKVYNGEVKAVDDVSFHVEAGETVVLLGPSGCGKTTLLRMVNGLESITNGDIQIDGKSTSALNKIDLRRNIGYVIQSNGLFPNMNIEQNVTVVPDLLGWDRKKKGDRYNYLMDLVGLNPDQFRKRYPHELSGGQQQRIGVVRALAADPPVMLMDEPFGALDPIIRERVQDEFLHIQQEVHKTILFVSHDIDEAIKMGDKIALMKDGKLMQYDPPADMLSQPKNDFVSQFVGQDRTLKRLNIHTLADLVQVMDLNESDATIEETKELLVTSSLRDTLSLILDQQVRQIIVVDNKGNNLGAIDFSIVKDYLSTRGGTESLSFSS
ncbi:ABC transporter ATP-binding protein [Thalassobacillus sp. CUG 92003]|uniref:ABC transporter ATP-binding protein n=1 Tax=Thalassobacillus sp. CUG 92003 TaxID=2736641 RepID=UPI0015E7E167|nr:ABC transporter ATP-binding protein [Thalassobacillus sp. CUG 92003]